VLATDISPRRLKAMTERFGVGSSVRTMVADATALPESEGTFDLILCDAPCTGTGTLARNPEIRHRLRRAEFARQAERQKLVLAAVAKRLKPGGKLIYSTCSLEPQENEDVVDAVMRSDDSLLRVPVEPVLQRLVDGGVLAADVWGAAAPGAVANGYLRTLPGKAFAADGFFVALFERAIG
jgi:16S rRNA (cytosine967-C5)-methyltransferase